MMSADLAALSPADSPSRAALDVRWEDLPWPMREAWEQAAVAVRI